MSDLGAIFHVTADGKQYNAHAYTTTDECPEPNLKVTYKGQQAYIKLDAKGEGDVPCYVKTKAGGLYQVKKEAVPTGALSIDVGLTISFTIPSGISVIMITGIKNGKPVETGKKQYVGVTSGKKYSILARIKPPDYPPIPPPISMLVNTANSTVWAELVDVIVDSFTISWSSEINKQTPNVKDY